MNLLTQTGLTIVFPNVPVAPVAQGSGYWVSQVDANGLRIAGTEELLNSSGANTLEEALTRGFGPSEVDYPRDLSRPLTETAASTIVKQQPVNDSRVRAWIWKLLPTGDYWAGYDRFIKRLETLLATERLRAGLPEHVYIRDDFTDAMVKWNTTQGTVSAASLNTMDDSIATWVPGVYDSGTVEIVAGTGVGQRRQVYTNTTSHLVLSQDWVINPVGATYTLRMHRNDWIKVRVTNVSKIPTPRATVEQLVRLEFLVIDTDANDWG